MAKTELTGGPTIIGETQIEYALGDPFEAGSAITLTLTVTPMQAAQLFGKYVQNRKSLGKGLPHEFTLMWIAASKGLHRAFVQNGELRKEVDDLTKRLKQLEEKV